MSITKTDRRTLSTGQMMERCRDQETSTEEVIGYLRQIDERLSLVRDRVLFCIEMAHNNDAGVELEARAILARYILPRMEANIKAYDWGYDSEPVDLVLTFYGESLYNSEVPERDKKNIHTFLEMISWRNSRKEESDNGILLLKAVAVTRHLKMIETNRFAACIPTLYAKLDQELLEWGHWERLPMLFGSEPVSIQDAERLDLDVARITRTCGKIVYDQNDLVRVDIARTILLLLTYLAVFREACQNAQEQQGS